MVRTAGVDMFRGVILRGLYSTVRVDMVYGSRHRRFQAESESDYWYGYTCRRSRRPVREVLRAGSRGSEEITCTAYVWDAIMRGDSDGSDCGGRLILPQSFIGGPRYMYAHYLDALAICRIHGNPSFFITFTCNVKWPEITEYMDDFLGLTTTDRADIVDQVIPVG
ncbi:DNA helicase [Tanacetum coccineum]